jgi:predicted hydrolase (HD superfamily)
MSDLSPGSVKKKLKNPKFAAKVDREEIQKGIAYLGIEESDHIAFIIDVLTKNRSELGI